MERIPTVLCSLGQRVQAYLDEEHTVTRPGASAGVWISFLLPTVIILSCCSCHNVTELYKIAATLSLGLLGTSVAFLAKPCKCKTHECALIVPALITYILLYFYNQIGVWFSIAGAFASYSFSEAVIYLLDAAPKSLTYGEASVLTQSLILFLFTTIINLVKVWQNVPVQCLDTSIVILQVLLVIYWVICSGLAVMAVNVQIQGQQRASTVVRKYFHILAVAVFIPGLIRECCFLYLASGVVLAVITALELLRVIHMPPLGDVLQAGFTVFADDKDVGSLAFTPIYLLAACSLPLWLYPSICLEEVYTGQHLLPLLSGLLSIGIGDTAASVFGTWIGKNKWRGTKKTKEGTTASILCQMIVILMLIYLGHISCSGILLMQSVFAVVVTAVLEARTDQVDNLVLPLVMYMLLLPLPWTAN